MLPMTRAIHRRRFLDLVLLSTGWNIPRFLSDTVERTRFGLIDSGEILGNSTTDLPEADVKINSIVADNNPG
jgi:hypothetical protein